MKQDFWKDIRTGDVIYMYRDSDLEINKATVKVIRDKSETTGSFIIDTDSEEHPTVFVYINNFDELVKHYKRTIKKKIDKQKALLMYYKCLLDQY